MQQFWELEQHGRRIALIEESRAWEYYELAHMADELAGLLPAGRGIGMLAMSACVPAVALYLGALRTRRQVPLLIQPDMHADLVADLLLHYQPEWFAAAGEAPEGYRTAYRSAELCLHVRTGFADSASLLDPHPDLALLMSTSGSTGSAKLVRLSHAAISANACAIADYLGLQPSDRAITILPLAYSFGLSILNSHLACGGAVVLSSDSLLTRHFWKSASANGVTSLSGVPATYEMLRRMGLPKLHAQLPSLRMLTQAGGRLREELVRYFGTACVEHMVQFFVMYGQTEASPRISYVPPERLLDKVGSIGIPIPGGRMYVDSTNGELVYEGPNAMMGYATVRDDLGRADEIHGVLRTGDLGRADDEGFYFITGRAKRFLKVSGHRINLDEVEAMLSAALGMQITCVGRDDDLVAFSSGDAVADHAQVRLLVQARYHLFGGHVRSLHVDDLPLLPNAKLDYQRLLDWSAPGAACT